MNPGRLSFAVLAALAAGTPAKSTAQEVSPADIRTPADTLTLEEAVGTALRHNPSLRQAIAGQEQAHAARRADWGAFLPSVDAGLDLSRTDFTTVTFLDPEGTASTLESPLESVTHGAGQRLSFGWDLLRGGRRFAGLRAGSHRATAADRRVAAEERRVVGEAKRAYYAALRRRRMVGMAERQLEGRRRDLDVARRRYEVAAVSRADLLGAEIALGQAELALLEARDLATRSMRELRVAMGLERLTEAGAPDAGPPDAAEPVPPRPVPSLPLRDVHTLPSPEGLESGRLLARALDTDPTLGALEADVAAASAAAWGARARYLPSIRLGYTLGRSESQGPAGHLFNFDLDNSGRTFSASLSWSLFDGFQRESEIASRTADRRRAEAQRRERRLGLEKEVRDLTDEIRRRARRLELQEDAFRLAEERLEMAREQYRLGAIGYYELQNAIRDLIEFERAVIEERYDYLAAWASLEERVGEIP